MDEWKEQLVEEAADTETVLPEQPSGAEACSACGGCACPHREAKELEAAELEEAVDAALAQELLPAGDAETEAEQETGMADVVDIRFRSGGKVYYFDPDGLDLHPEDHVIIDTARGAEYGICSSGCHKVPVSDVVAPLRKVLRIATEQDEKTAAENREKEKRAYKVCLQKIRDHKLEMQLVSAECAFDGSKILFFFTADGRIDFRELVKNLASVFRTRIELRQIGVRDKAKMVGGLGVCGRPFCCSEFLDDFQPVSIKMAKTQNLSLNPTKISGTCGRLMCCLKYEQKAYEDLLKTAPKPDSFVDTPDGRGTVCDVNLLRQTVKVRMEHHPETIGSYHNTEIAILRNGKAKKTDPPIPEDLAPISGRPRPVRRQEAAAEDTMPQLFRRLDEYALTPSEKETAAGEAAGEAQEKPAHRRRSRRRRKPAGDGAARPAQEQAAQGGGKPQQPHGTQQAAPPQPSGEGGSKPRRRRRSHRPRNPGGPQAGQDA